MDSQENSEPLKSVGEVSGPPEIKNKLAMIATIIVVVIVLISILILALLFGGEDEKEIDFSIETVTFDGFDDVQLDSAHYLYNGKILIAYNSTSGSETNFAVIDDNGKNLKKIYTGYIPSRYKNTNGIRTLPFADGKRVLLGDYILECTNYLEKCDDAKLIPINYPDIITKENAAYRIWSEPIISQDNVHIAWTTLDPYVNSVNFLGKLSKKDDCYNITDVKIISNSFTDKYNSSTGILNIDVIRGGEVKQFTKGGLALTLAGTDGMGLPKSVYQDLTSEKVYGLSHEPGYDETSILSPDGKLGIAMSTRFSNSTNFAIIGLLPIPFSCLATATFAMDAYIYGVTNVRTSRKGNIGPVLFDVEKSIDDDTYHGLNLNKEENWNFASPISWHYSSLKAIFLEVSKDALTQNKRRIRKVTVNNYTPGDAEKNKTTPDSISYAHDISDYGKLPVTDATMTILGKKGNITYTIKDNTSKLVYNNYSKDGKSFFNGEISSTKLSNLYAHELRSNVVATGSVKGNANYTIIMKDGESGPEFDWEKTTGSSTYNGKTINVDIYKE